jgi:hypothetical protein
VTPLIGRGYVFLIIVALICIIPDPGVCGCLEKRSNQLVEETIVEMKRMNEDLPGSVRGIIKNGKRIAVTVANGNMIIATEKNERITANRSEWIREVQRYFELAVNNNEVLKLVTIDEIPQKAISKVLKARYWFNDRDIISKQHIQPLEHIENINAILFWFYAPTSDGRVTLNLDMIFLDGHMVIPTQGSCEMRINFNNDENQRVPKRLTDKRSEVNFHFFTSSTARQSDAPGVDTSIRGGEIGGQVYFNRSSRYFLKGRFTMSHADTLGVPVEYKEAAITFMTDYRIKKVLNLGAGIDASYRFDTIHPDPSFTCAERVHVRLPIKPGLGLGSYHDRFVQANVLLLPRLYISTGEQGDDASAFDWGGEFEFGIRDFRLDLVGAISYTANASFDEQEDNYRRVAGRLMFGGGGWTTKLQIGVAYEQIRHYFPRGENYREETCAIIVGFGVRNHGEVYFR